MIGPFGTREHPTIVKSAFTSRIVGCTGLFLIKLQRNSLNNWKQKNHTKTGGKGDSAHEILWHEVREGRPTVCMECGQFFQLEFDKEKVEKVLGYREQNAKNVGADTSKGLLFVRFAFLFLKLLIFFFLFLFFKAAHH